MTMSAPSKKSVIRRRKNGHFTAMDLSYQTFMCVVHQTSIGLSNDDDADAASATEDPAVDISFLESILCFDASNLIVAAVAAAVAGDGGACFRIRTGDENAHLLFACSGKRISKLIATFLLGENPWTKCRSKRSEQLIISGSIRTAIFSL
jgi:hypothetical protein